MADELYILLEVILDLLVLAALLYVGYYWIKIEKEFRMMKWFLMHPFALEQAREQHRAAGCEACEGTKEAYFKNRTKPTERKKNG